MTNPDAGLPPWKQMGGAYSFYDWASFVDINEVARKLAIYEMLKIVAPLAGWIAEVGCWKGSGLIFMAKAMTIIKPMQGTKVVGFESFHGLTQWSEEKDLPPNDREGRYASDPEALRDIIKEGGMTGFVQLVEGDVAETIPAFMQERKDVRFSFVYIDTDLYEPGLAAMKHLWPKMLTGGIMAFDEWNFRAWPGETSAVMEVLGDDAQILSVPGCPQPGGYVVKGGLDWSQWHPTWMAERRE